VATVARSRIVDAPPATVWRVVSDPFRLPAWWPLVQRVEEATPEAWTKVLSSPKGKAVRADYTLVESEPERRLVWRQEVEETPFERLMSEATTEIGLDPRGESSTEVSLTARMSLRGFARLGALQLRRATARRLEDALDGLEAVFSPEEG
jgi:uncharacterized protein YndB with AHSA1/START domain